MATGIIVEYDPDKRRGYLVPDTDNEEEKIPFEIDKKNDPGLRPGDSVSYDVEGGLAGIMAIEVRKL